jgi:hypothetical protein
VSGLWRSKEGTLFFVSKVYVEGFKQAKSLFNHEGDGSLKEDRIRVRLGLILGINHNFNFIDLHFARSVKNALIEDKLQEL